MATLFMACAYVIECDSDGVTINGYPDVTVFTCADDIDSYQCEFRQVITAYGSVSDRCVNIDEGITTKAGDAHKCGANTTSSQLNHICLTLVLNLKLVLAIMHIPILIQVHLTEQHTSCIVKPRRIHTKQNITPMLITDVGDQENC